MNPFGETGFPPTETALDEPNGLLAVGGDLSPNRLIAAYRHGIFPWFDEDQPILWWTPTPRAVLFPADFHCSKSLAKTLRSNRFSVSCDRAFREVMQACAEPRKDGLGTWISPQIISAYSDLHKKGVTHSIEVWRDDQLVGGLYGLRMGRVFFGESMFSVESDASKTAVAALIYLAHGGAIEMIDCQVESAHLNSLGSRLLPRREFEKLLHNWIPSDEPCLGSGAMALDEQLHKRLPTETKDLL